MSHTPFSPYLRILILFQHVIERMVSHRTSTLRAMAQRMHSWRRRVRLHRQVHTVLNMWNYDLARKVLVAEAWCPASLSEATAAALRRASARSRAHAPSIVSIPPFFPICRNPFPPYVRDSFAFFVRST